MFRFVALGVGALLTAAIAFLVVTRLGEMPTGPEPIPGVTSETKCEIELGPERCPGLPSHAPSRASRIFFDTWENAATDPDRCMRRAAEFHAACKGRTPIRARFLVGREVVRATVHPAAK